jgi:hypothetical protein
MQAKDLLDPYLARIGADWIAYFSAPEGIRDADPMLFNPWGIVSQIVRHSSLEAWDLIQFILAQDEKAQTLDLLSAGPLEDFISLHGANWIESIEDAAKENARFRSLLAGVWQLSTPDDIWSRVVAARGDAKWFECE